MKKILLSLTALVILGLPKVSAQVINPGFETWNTDAIAGGSVMDPNNGLGNNGWWDFNFTNESLFFGGSPVTVFKGTASPSPENGSAYAEIVSQAMTNSTYNMLKTYGFSYPDTNGLVLTAYINISGASLTYKRGEPFTQRINTYSFYYRYIPNGGDGADTATCGVVLYKAGAVIGAGLWKCFNTTSAWTSATIPISYTTSGNPDTILVVYNACSNYHNHGHIVNGPRPGDTLDVDNSTVTGIDNIAEQHDKVNLYPNPANTEINLSVSGQYQAGFVQVYDMTGREIGTYPMRNNFLTINTQSYTGGLYIYKLLDDSGNQLNVGKFSVVK